jgi:catalase
MEICHSDHPGEEWHDFEFGILDATKIWPEEHAPLQVIGEFVLDRVVDEFFTETEQVAFCTRYAQTDISLTDARGGPTST